MKTTRPVIIGIDTHKASHVAVAIDTQGTRLAALSIPTNPKGYLELDVGRDLSVTFWHSGSEELVRMAQAFPSLCSPKVTM